MIGHEMSLLCFVHDYILILKVSIIKDERFVAYLGKIGLADFKRIMEWWRT